MVTSKPAFNSLFALWLFVILSIGTGVVLLITYEGKLWQEILIVLIMPLGLVLGFRNIWSYKQFIVGQNKIRIRYPLRFHTIQFNLKELAYWEEQEVTTLGKLFQEITLVWENRKFKLSNQEFTNYKQVRQYLYKKAPRKLRKQE